MESKKNVSLFVLVEEYPCLNDWKPFNVWPEVTSTNASKVRMIPAGEKVGCALGMPVGNKLGDSDGLRLGDRLGILKVSQQFMHRVCQLFR